jgi:hypothetical protein
MCVPVLATKLIIVTRTTPNAAKALELFLGLIIDEASKVTVERGSKKVEAYHLYVPVLVFFVIALNSGMAHRKHAVDTTEMLDFLKEIVEAVPDPSSGGTIDLEGQNAEKKKRGKGKRAAGNGNGEATTRKKRKKKGEAEGEVAEAEVETKSEPDPDDAEDTNMEDPDYESS